MKHLNEIETTFQEATSLYENQEISKEEYLNLLKGLEVEKAVVLGKEQLDRKTQLQSLVENTISVVSAIA